MALSLSRKVRLLSRSLKFVCVTSIILAPFLTVAYWLIDISPIKIVSDWYIQFSDMPLVQTQDLPLKMRVYGIAIDMIPCAFFAATLFFLTKLFRQYERFQFFAKANSSYIRWVAILLFVKTLAYPFYTSLRSFVFLPSDQNHAIIIFFGPHEFKSLIAVLAVVLFAYLTEMAMQLEEDLVGTI